MKKIFLITWIALVAGCSPAPKKEIALVEFVPHNASLVLQVNDSIALRSSKNLAKILALDETLHQTVKNITPKNASLPQLYFISPIGKSENAVGLIYKIQATDTLPIHSKTIEYSNQHIGVTTVADQTCYSTQLGDTYLVSQSQLIIENAIRNFEKNQRGIGSTSFYRLAESMDTNSSANLFLHPTSSDLIGRLLPLTPLFPNTGGDWIELDLETEEETPTAHGVALLNDSIPNALSLIRDMKSQALTLPAIVPQNFTAYLGFPISDLSQLEDNFKRLSRKMNLPIKAIDISKIKGLNEIAWVWVGDEKSIVLQIENGEEFPNFISKNGEYKKYRSAQYQKIVLPPDFSHLLNLLGDEIVPQWGAYLDNLLFMSTSESGLKNILGQLIDKKTLLQSPAFQNLNQSLATQSSFLWLGQTKNLLTHWQQNNAPQNTKDIPAEDFPLLAFQGVGEKDFAHLHFSIQKNIPAQTIGGANTAFTIAMSKAAASPPQWLKNHRNKGMDIAIQDIDHVLYLFSNSGKLYWKKQLPGKIIGPIQQVDLYKNNRLQMAFRTPERFIILDRNGKTVQPFEISLPKNNNPLPLSVFDYDNNRNYRFLLAQDQNLLMYDGKGKRVNGFSLKKTNSNIVSAPKHIRFQSKDYIVMPLENNRLKIVSRTGKDRVQVKANIEFSDNPIFSYLNTFTTTDQTGNLVQVDTKGNTVRSKLGLAPQHKIDATTKSLVTLSENKLNIKGIPVTLPFGSYTPPKIFYLNNTLYIATTDREADKVHLFYSNGEAVKGFPVYGSSMVDLTNSDKDKALEMVVTSKDNSLLVYKIN